MNSKVMNAWRYVFLFFILILFFSPQSLISVNIFDEGFIVSGGMLVHNGKLPYRDFLSMYGPGQYYLTSLIFSLFGEQLIFVRAMHVTLLATLGLLVYRLAEQNKNSNHSGLLVLIFYTGIVVYAKPNVGHPGITTTIFLLLSALIVKKWSEACQVKYLLLASCMIGIAGLFRWDFGVFGLVALVGSLLTYFLIKNTSKVDYVAMNVVSEISLATGPAILILLAVYVPLIAIFSNPVQWFNEVPLFAITEFAKWRGLDYIKPTIWRYLKDSNSNSLFLLVANLGYSALPTAAVLAGTGTIIYSTFRRTLPLKNQGNLILISFLTILCLGLLNQMRIRPGLQQGFPAIVVALPLLKISISSIANKAFSGRAWRMAYIFLTTVSAIVTLRLASGQWNAYFGTSMFSAEQTRMSGIRLDQKNIYYLELIAFISANTKPGEAIYSGVQDHTRLFFNDAILYFLTNRLPADRFLELEPGISNTSGGQQSIINSLQSNNVNLVVLMDLLGYESNQTSVSNGITILDDYIRNNYHLNRSFGTYQVFLKN